MKTNREGSTSSWSASARGRKGCNYIYAQRRLVLFFAVISSILVIHHCLRGS
jgi:hypothetical protein